MLPVLQLGTGRVPGGHESGVVGIGHDTGQLRTQAPQHLWTVPGGRADYSVYAALDRGFACFNVFVGIVLHPRRGIGTVIGEETGKNRVKHGDVSFRRRHETLSEIRLSCL